MLFLLPQEEARMPLANQEGPVGLIVCPSRELARQTYDVIVMYADVIQHETVLPNPKLRVMLCIGELSPKALAGNHESDLIAVAASICRV